MMIGSHADENAISNWNELFCLMRGMMIQDMGVSLNGGTPKTPQNDHF